MSPTQPLHPRCQNQRRPRPQTSVHLDNAVEQKQSVTKDEPMKNKKTKKQKNKKKQKKTNTKQKVATIQPSNHPTIQSSTIDTMATYL
jgi:hypothetical protein